jgi:hypothetical protein
VEVGGGKKREDESLVPSWKEGNHHEWKLCRLPHPPSSKVIVALLIADTVVLSPGHDAIGGGAAKRGMVERVVEGRVSGGA